MSTKLCTPFSRGDNSDIVKMHFQNLKIFFSRTTRTVSFGEGRLSLFKRRVMPILWGDNIDNKEIKNKGDIIKIPSQQLEIFFSKATIPISTKLGKRNHRGERLKIKIKNCFSENAFLLFRNVLLHKSLVSNLSHWTLVM